MMSTQTNEAIFIRSIQMLVRGGLHSKTVFTETLGQRGWKRFPVKYQNLMKVLWTATSSFRLNQVEGKLSADDLTLLATIHELDQPIRWELADFQITAKSVNERYLQFVVQKTMTKWQTGLTNGEMTLAQVQSNMSRLLIALNTKQPTASLQDGSEGIDEALALVEAWESGKLDADIVLTDFKQLDYYGFLGRAEVAAILGETGVGKSALAFQIAANIAKRMKREKRSGCLVIFSMEMTHARLWLRLAAADTSIDYTDFRRGKLQPYDVKSFKATLKDFKQLPIKVSEQSGLTVPEMKLMMEQASREFGGVELVLLDYTSKVNPDKKTFSKADEVQQVMEDFRTMIKNHHNPDSSRPAGLVIAPTLKTISNNFGSLEEIMRDGGHYEVGSAILPVALKKKVDANDWSTKQHLINEGIDIDNLTQEDRSIHIPKSRHNESGTMTGWYFFGRLTKWEDTRASQ